MWSLPRFEVRYAKKTEYPLPAFRPELRKEFPSFLILVRENPKLEWELSSIGYPCTILQTGYKVFGSTNRIAQSKHQKGHLPIYSAQTDAENHYNYT